MTVHDLQRILDHHHVGQIESVETKEDGLWYVRTNRGLFLIIDLGDPARAYSQELEQRHEAMLQHPTARQLLQSDYRGNQTVRIVHVRDHYFSVFRLPRR